MRKPYTLLITAGPTVEDIDPVRFISNRASGRLGFEFARAALRQRWRVILVHGPVADDVVRILSGTRRGRLERRPVRSAAQMRSAVLTALPEADAVIMNAAVADFAPVRMAANKRKKARAGLVLRLKPTVDILAELGRIKRTRKRPLMLVGFALETGRGRTEAARAAARLREARRKRRDKNVDLIVLDTPAEIASTSGSFSVLGCESESPVSFRGSKRAFAAQLIRLLK